MPRPRKPTALLELSGAFKANPQRRRPNEPQESRPLGDPPGRLPSDAVPFWHELVGMCAHGVLKYGDRWAVEIAATLMWRFSMGNEEPGDKNVLRSYLASLGLTPADRSKLSVQPEKQKNEFADLAEETREFAEKPN